MSSTAVQLEFVGEILPGFSPIQVRQKLGQRLRLDSARLDRLFSGRRVVIKRDLNPAEAADWVRRFRAMGAVLNAVPTRPTRPMALRDGPTPPPPAPPTPAPVLMPSSIAVATPAVATPAVATPSAMAPPPRAGIMLSLVPDSVMPTPTSPPPPAPLRGASPSRAAKAAPASEGSGSEQVSCPQCGERQLKRVICRACLCDMPRMWALQKAEAEARRQARLDELRARNQERLAQENARLANRDLELAQDPPPPLLSLSPEGRMGRLRYFSINMVGMSLAVIALFWTFTVLLRPTPTTLVPLGLAVLALLLWVLRVTALRLHDFGESGWWALLMLVPVLNGLFMLAVLLWPGDREENEYGKPVDDGNWLWALIGLVIVGAATALNSPRVMNDVCRAWI